MFLPSSIPYTTFGSQQYCQYNDSDLSACSPMELLYYGMRQHHYRCRLVTGRAETKFLKEKEDEEKVTPG